MVADEVDDEVEGEYSSNESAGGSGLIEKSAKSKSFKNPKSKNHCANGKTQLPRPRWPANFR